MGKEAKTDQGYREFVKIPNAETESACLSAIKDWLKKQPHLPQDIPDNSLLQFLHCSYYSIEKTKRVIDANFTIRTNTPEIFHNRDPRSQKSKEMMELVHFFMFDKPTPRGEKILFFTLSTPDPAAYDYPESTKYSFAIMDVYVEEDGRQPGYILIFDVVGLQLAHLTQMTKHFSMLKKEALYAQEALPFCLMGIYLINAPPAIDVMFNVIRPLITSDVLKLIHFYRATEMDKFYEIVPKELLPQEYGGDAPTKKEQSAKAAQKLLDNEKLLKFKETQIVNEKLRMTPSNLGDSLQGSFKILELD